MLYPVGPNETERLQALRALNILDTPPDPLIDQVCALAQQRFGVPMAVVTLVDRNRAWFKSACGLDGDGVPRELAFCNHAILADEVFAVPDLTADPRFGGNALVTSESPIRFYAGAPLALQPGLRLGTLCIMDSQPRSLGAEDMAALRSLADLVEGFIRLHEARQAAAHDLAASETWRALIAAQAQELERKQAVLSHTERLANVGGWELEPDTGRVTWSNQMFAIYELPPEEGVDLARVRQSFSAADQARLAAESARVRREGSSFDLELPFTTAKGNARWVRAVGQADTAEGRPARLFGILKDITEQKASEFRMWWLANHDELTGLPNRTLLRERLAAALAGSGRRNARVGLLLIDIDQFKEVNDTLGHDAGDALLREVARRLSAVAPRGATVARLGGDEFAVVLPQVADHAAAERAVAAILDALREPVPHLEQVLSCRASIGVTVYPDDDADSESLLKNADVALYAAKAAGRDGFARYQPDMRSALQKRIRVLGTVRQALADDRVVPFYQPKISLATGEVVGFEALLRWRDPDKGFQAPGTILEAFDDAELGCEIGARMLEKVAADMSAWLDAGVAFGHVALNASAAEFRREGFAGRILAKLAEAGISHDRFELEVTESVFLGRGAESVGQVLRALDRKGVAIALDDFGTGYASLTHVKQYPVRWLKVDRSFVRDIGHDADAAAIVDAVIGLGRSLGIGLVAEGVETEEQVAFLRRRGCDVGQGYLFGKPMIGSRVRQYLKTANFDRLLGLEPIAKAG